MNKQQIFYLVSHANGEKIPKDLAKEIDLGPNVPTNSLSFAWYRIWLCASGFVCKCQHVTMS